MTKSSTPLHSRPLSSVSPKLIEELTNDPLKPLEEEWDYLDDKLSEFLEEQGEELFRTSRMNNRKNRYGDVLANEGTRVRLQYKDNNSEMPDVLLNDYINANWVDGQLGSDTEKAYIATQGPLESTIGDFLRMIWHEKVSSIVMVTNEMERGRIKCARYWPTEISSPIYADPFIVSFKSETSPAPGLVVRQLQLENIDTKETRELIQFQYVAWPDHGVPSDTQEFLDFVEIVDKSRRSGPLVVHCSAGLGRTGVFIVVHSTFAYLKHHLAATRHQTCTQEEPPFDMAKIITEIRKQRHGMVQTFEQYQFCWEAIAQGVRKSITPKKERDD